MSYYDIWHLYDEDQKRGLEAEANRNLTLRIVSYDDQQYFWEVAIGDKDYDDIYESSSADEDLFFDNIDEAWIGCMEYLEEHEREAYDSCKNVRDPDNFKDFAVMGLQYQMPVSLATVFLVGVL